MKSITLSQRITAGLKGPSTATMLLSATLLGGVAFSSNPAQAQLGPPGPVVCTFGVASPTCAVNGVLDIGDKLFTLRDLPEGSGEISIQTGPLQNFYVLNVSFEPDFESGVSGLFNYDVEVKPTSPDFITLISLELDDQLPSTATVSKTIRTGTNNFAGAALGTIFDGQTLAVNGKAFSVSEAYSTTGDNVIISLSNGILQTTPSSVPGPLPLLGAGAAFGFSRKLRTRVKAAAQA